MNRNFTRITAALCILTSCGNIVSNAQSPGYVAGSKVWLKANVGTTLNASNNVTTWAEQSGAGVTGDFSTHNPGAGSQTQLPPTFVTSGFNFNPFLQFISSNPNCISSNNLIAGSSILGSNEMTMFQVINLHPITLAKPASVWCKWQTSNTAAYRLGDETNTGTNLNKIRLDFRNSGSPLVGASVATDRQVIYTAGAASTSLFIRLNGATDATATPSGTFSPSGTARLSLGNENEAGADAYPSNIDIAEFILFNRALTAAERNRVESYLAVKYGFTLVQTGTDANDYTNSVGTVIWNHTANAPFINNITGIGRDDSSALNQKQSLSINNRAMVTMYNGSVPGTFPTDNASNTNDFAADKSFVLFGDNQLDTLVTHCSTDKRYARMARVWKVQATTSIPVTLSLIKANVPPQITTLIVASDPNFTTGVQFIPIQDNGTNLYASHTVATTEYFTFGTTPLSLNPTINQVKCQGANGSIILNPVGGTTPLTYSWNTTPPQTTQNLNNLDVGNYTVTVSQGSGCVYTESFTVTGNPVPVFVKVRDTANTICTTNNGLIDVSGIGGTPSYTYSIDGSPFVSQGHFTDLTSGTHTIQIKDQNGCMKDTTVKLSRYTYNLDVSDSAKNAWCDAGGLAGVIQVFASGGADPYGYFWEDVPTAKGPIQDNLPKGTYKIIVTDVYGCSGTVTTSIDENSCCQVGIPNAFSPNGDGLNDEFKSVTNRSIPKYEMAIYDRWGQRVFYTTQYDQGWNGAYQNGTKLEDPGTYFYKIKYTCEKGNKVVIYQGDLTLIR